MQKSTNSNRQSIHSMPPALKFFVKWIFPLLFIAVGGGLLAHGLLEVQRGHASTDWPSTQGTIISSVIQERVNRSNERGSGRTYHADITYTYDVNSTTLIGDRVAIGDYGSSSRSHARSILARYPEGENVEVYYDPEAPEISLLEPGVTLQAYFQPGIGAIFLIAGLGLFVIFRFLFAWKAEALAALEDDPK